MSRKHKINRGIVYSTEVGEMCPVCSLAKKMCRCKQTQAFVPGDGIVRISRQTKGRKGKGVTLISGLSQEKNELTILAKRLKQNCGTGGTVKNGVIEIQGDHRDRLKNILESHGYTVKLAGG